MDLPVDLLNRHFFTKYNIYPSGWAEDYWLRQLISCYVFIYIAAMTAYFIFCPFVYFLVFDHRLMKHPLFLKNQVRREIQQSVFCAVALTFPIACVIVPEFYGYSKLYMLAEIEATGSEAMLLIIRDFIGVVLVSDCLIYWIHRFMHHRSIYRHIHKPHHIWKIPTPFASFAFHPIDGFLQGLPYHIYPYFFPLNKYVYLIMFFVVNLWTISIHDGDYRVPAFFRPFINGSAHHTDHHLYYNYNYGQYFTLWDRIGGSYRNPSVYEGISLVDAVLGKGSGDVPGENECDGYTDKMHKG